MNLDIEDFQEEAGSCRVITSFEAFTTVKKALDDLGYSLADADMQYLPQNEITLSDEDMKSFEDLYNALEEDEDVDSIYHNVA
ncbi:YebC/PmpR family DNA-binding transcriptional regulator [Patescibacteria group bacterium]|nr:YebC/PmpR family DNA-binding transcriptional regulator [Patescibacteria group bacterium]